MLPNGIALNIILDVMTGLTSTCREAELHAAWRSGDVQAATELIVRYRPRLQTLGKRLGLPSPDTDDFAHDVLLEAHRSSFAPRPGASYWSWLAAIGRRQAPKMRQRSERILLPRRRTSPWSAECRRRLLLSIIDMPAGHSQVFVRLLHGYDPGEIADELGISRAATYMRISRGRRWLRARGH